MEELKKGPLTKETASERLDAMLWECIDCLAVYPRAKIDPRTWRHLLIYAPVRIVVWTDEGS